MELLKENWIMIGFLPVLPHVCKWTEARSGEGSTFIQRRSWYITDHFQRYETRNDGQDEVLLKNKARAG